MVSKHILLLGLLIIFSEKISLLIIGKVDKSMLYKDNNLIVSYVILFALCKLDLKSIIRKLGKLPIIWGDILYL